MVLTLHFSATLWQYLQQQVFKIWTKIEESIAHHASLTSFTLCPKIRAAELKNTLYFTCMVPLWTLSKTHKRELRISHTHR